MSLNLPQLKRYLHAVQSLKTRQITSRLRRKLLPNPRVSLQLKEVPFSNPDRSNWIPNALKTPELVDADHLQIHGQKILITDGEAWLGRSVPRLTSYHLHYFDDLTAEGFESRRSWQSDLIQRWIGANRPGIGPGWEPYPLSRRTCNWIKYHLNGNPLSEEAWHSLFLQLRWLFANLEWHQLGNHLLANLKAMLFGTAVFEGVEARRWLDTCSGILLAELDEQILADGGHFELSPMYQCIVLEDLLDLLNLVESGLWTPSSNLAQELRTKIEVMQAWLSVLLHPDQGIPLFSDSTFGNALSPRSLFDYYDQLELSRSTHHSGLSLLPESGYVKLARSSAVVVIDVGPLGASYLPGHGHADVLSFELSHRGQRYIVDPAVSTYEPGSQRSWERSTRAHNTVCVNDTNSSDLWGAFRAGVRARPFDLLIESDRSSETVACSHDGYRRQFKGPIHRRRFQLGEKGLLIRDRLEGPFREASLRLLLCPSIEVELQSERTLRLHHPGQPEGISFTVSGARFGVHPASFASGFLCEQETTAVDVSFEEAEVTQTLAWN